MLRLVQLQKGPIRRVAAVEEPHLRFLEGDETVYGLVAKALSANTRLGAQVEEQLTSEKIGYEAVHAGDSAWKILLPIDHPSDASRCLVSGTGLTHLGSAKNRQAMHAVAEAQVTDSMRMFRAGVEGGRPKPGEIGTAPEWFYKGNGSILRAHLEPLEVPPYANDGGEEAEIAGVYVIDAQGRPRRVGMVLANEFSDHVFEKTNYLNLAGSKIRTCSLGPELVVAPNFQSVPGKVTIERGGAEIWSKEIATGEDEMCHSLANIEHHHFKFEAHRRPGDLHVHYYGANSLSFGAGVRLLHGDVMTIGFSGFGRPLRNPLRVSALDDAVVSVLPLA